MAENESNLRVIEQTLPGAAGRPFLADARFVEDGRPKPVVVFAHGFKGFKDWGHFNQIAGAFAARGFVFVKFNFSHNGTTPEQPEDFADLEAFGQNNHSKELEDLGVVVDAVAGGGWLPAAETDPARLFLAAHSRGGPVALLRARRDPRVAALATWAGIKDFWSRYAPELVAKWKTEGVIYAPNARANQQMPMRYQLIEDLERHAETLDVGAAAAAFDRPWLIVHGADDESVSPDNARALAASAPNGKMLLIEGAGHTFGGKHPWNEPQLPEASRELVEATAGFFRGILRQ